MKAKLLFLILICLVGQLPAQELIGKKSIYFESGKHNLSSESKKLLDIMCDSFKSFKSYRIIIRGNTDDVGDSLFNIRLSEKRVNETRKYFDRKGIPPSAYTLSFLGENKPLVSNASDQGKQKNRRVDIFYKYVRKTDSIIKLPSIRELYRKLERPAQQFCINPLRDTTIRGEQGTLVYIRADAFKLSNTCKKSCVTFILKEDFLKSDMFLDNLSTMSGDFILESQGMVYTEAKDCNGKNIPIRKDMDITIMTPTDTILPDAKLFAGDFTLHDYMINWSLENDENLSGFTTDDVLRCYGILCGGVKTMSDCQCRFLFCRVKRTGKWVKGWFSTCGRRSNKVFRKDMRICKLEKQMAGIKQNEQLTKAEKKEKTEIINKKIIQLRETINAINLKHKICVPQELKEGEYHKNPCEELLELFDLAGVNNMNDFLLVMNRKMLDSFGVKTIQELNDTIQRLENKRTQDIKKAEMARYGVNTAEALNDTLRKLKLGSIEALYRNKKIGNEDLEYYIFNTDRLGWKNVDFYAAFKDSIITLKVNLKADTNIDCKIALKNRRIFIPANPEKGKFQFTNVPKNEEAWIIAIKYLDGKAFLYIEEITTGRKPIQVEFKEYSLEELREKLKMLNQ